VEGEVDGLEETAKFRVGKRFNEMKSDMSSQIRRVHAGLEQRRWCGLVERVVVEGAGLHLHPCCPCSLPLRLGERGDGVLVRLPEDAMSG